MILMNRTHLFFTVNKHMMKYGAPPDNFGVYVPYAYLYNSMVSQAELILRLSLFRFLVLSQYF